MVKLVLYLNTIKKVLQKLTTPDLFENMVPFFKIDKCYRGIKNEFTIGAGNDFMDMFPNLVKAIFS